MRLPKIDWHKVADALLQVGLEALAGWVRDKAVKQGNERILREEPTK